MRYALPERELDDSTRRALSALVTEPAVMASLMSFHEIPPAEAGGCMARAVSRMDSEIWWTPSPRPECFGASELNAQSQESAMPDAIQSV